ncbi:MAG TPA: amidohydrolase, partial [Phaeodactylibacter sp.]|nr:amidohydrolase [Phaeodactylibacter sp.]
MAKLLYTLLCLLLTIHILPAQSTIEKADKLATEINQQVIKWRRHCHQHPELSNREFKTAKYIAQQLRAMGLQVEEGIAKTGVVALLDTHKQGPTIGLRADIDGLPVTERVDIPFKSTVTTQYNGKEVGVMHACGHDTHIAMLLGTASILTKLKDDLHGRYVFVFQPAEEGAPKGEEGGAELMIKEGILEKYNIDVFFGQHISSQLEVGHISYRLGGIMAASDVLSIKVKGKQTHGSRPWAGVDPIVASAQIIMGLQTIISRQTELTKQAAVITIGAIHGGVRNNIIPEEVEMIGTIRTLDTTMQRIIHEKIRNTVTLIAEAQGATAEVDIKIGYPVTYNDPALTREMIASLFDAAGEDNVHIVPAITGAEDFSFFARRVPAIYYFVGGKPKGETNPAPH